MFTGKDDKTTTTLRQYLLHRAYGALNLGFTLKDKANVSQQEALFVPSGTLIA